MDNSEVLNNVVGAYFDAYKSMHNIMAITTMAELQELKTLIFEKLGDKYDYEDIDECIISLQRKDVESIGAKFNSYPMIMSLNDDDGFPIQIVWALSQSSGIMLYNKDDNSPFQAGQMISRFKSDKYKPYNKIFLMANDGVIIPSFINDFIQKQFDNGQR